MSEKPFRVMLAVDYDPAKLTFPCFASTKLDGVRAYVRDGVVLSRKNKPIPNKYVQSLFAKHEHHDGELIVGDMCSEACFRDTMSGVMSVDGEPDVRFYVFDHLADLAAPYEKRLQKIIRAWGRMEPLGQVPIYTPNELATFEASCLELGYEGVILRRPNAPYKQGRSTVNEGFLLKVKSFKDAEAEVIGFEERMENLNEAKTDETGHTKRSSHKANKVGRGDLGALIVEWGGVQFNIGTGFVDAERQHIWDNREKFHGQLVKFKYFPVGVKEAPRHPVFLGWRDRIDL